MVNVNQLLMRNLENSIAAKQALINDLSQQAAFERAVLAVIACYQKGGRIYIAGNGGSAADAQHLAAEFVSRLAKDRNPLPAEALTVDSSILTAIGNDYGYEQIFSRQIRGKMRKEDIFLGITTSGNSANIIEALIATNEMGIPSIIFSGHQGGKIGATMGDKALCDHLILAPGKSTATIQEVHILLAHTLCESVEITLFGG